MDPVEVILHNGVSPETSSPATLTVRNDCDGEPKCVQIYMRWFGTPPGLWAEAHLNHREVAELVMALTQAVAEGHGVDLVDERNPRPTAPVVPATVIAWGNGMVMTFDPAGDQMPELQGRYSATRDNVLAAAGKATRFYSANWREGLPIELSREDWAQLQIPEAP